MGGAAVAAGHYINGDWHVRNHTLLRDATIVVNGTLFLDAGRPSLKLDTLPH